MTTLKLTEEQTQWLQNLLILEEYSDANLFWKIYARQILALIEKSEAHQA